MSAALAARRSGRVLAAPSTTVTAVTAPLTPAEQVAITSCVRRLKRELSGAPSRRRRPARAGAVDLRRPPSNGNGRRALIDQLPRISTRRRPTGGAGRPQPVARDLPLVLHLLHRLRSSVGSLRTFGFVDTFVPIDRALRTDDAIVSNRERARQRRPQCFVGPGPGVAGLVVTLAPDHHSGDPCGDLE